MNWLAHTLLSKRDIDYQLGNVLADPFKGRLWSDANQSIRDGVQMHKSIDLFTDSHEAVIQCKARLGEKGYLKGVVVDLLFDHFLSQLWEHYSEISLETFVTQFHSQAKQSIIQFPTEEKFFIQRIIASNLLLSYQDFDGFILSLQRVENRLSARIKKKDSILNYIPLVENQYHHMFDDFKLFFPELIKYFKKHDLGDETNNYLK